MKTAIVGPGAVGCFYGAKLAKTGEEVSFLVRSDWESIALNGVRIISDEGNVLAQPMLAIVPEEIGPVELVVVTLKTTANDRFLELIGPLVGPGTVILTLQNGLGNEAQLAELFGEEKIMGGLCFVCLHRIEPGVVHHIAYGKINMGEFAGGPTERTHEVARFFRSAGIPVQVTESLERARWEKLVWNIPFNGLGIAASVGHDAVVSGELPEYYNAWDTFGTDQLLADSRWEELVKELMDEIIMAARELGLNLSPSLAERQINLTREMGNYRPSTLVDFENGKPLELESIFLAPLNQALAVGIEMPRLSKLCSILQQLNPPVPVE